MGCAVGAALLATGVADAGVRVGVGVALGERRVGEGVGRWVNWNVMCGAGRA